MTSPVMPGTMRRLALATVLVVAAQRVQDTSSATLPAICPKRCTKATMYQDCIDPNYAFGALPDSNPAVWPNSDCGSLDCDEVNGGKCVLDAWVENVPGCSYRFCAGDNVLCDGGGPTALAAEGKVQGTCKQPNNECLYQWCPHVPTALTKKLPDICSTKCSTHFDCLDANNAMGTLPDSTPLTWPNSDCGSVACDAPSGQCRLVAWKKDDPRCGYKLCKNDAGCAGGGPTGLAFVDGKCENVGDECVYRWCIGGEYVNTETTTDRTLPPTASTKPPQVTTVIENPPAFTTTTTTKGTTTTTKEATTTAMTTTTTTTTTKRARIEDYSCRAPGKTPCSSVSDCIDAAGVFGVDPDCGTLQCDSAMGACTFEAWKDGPACELTLSTCIGIDALCYSGPSSLSFLGSCSGYLENGCRYAWCPGDQAPPPTTPPPPPTTTATTKSPLGIISFSLEPSVSLTVGVGDNKKIVARGTDGGGTVRDVTFDAAWTSSNPAVVAVALPGLAEAKISGTAVLTATIEGKVATVTVTVKPAQAGTAASCDERMLRMRALVVKQDGEMDGDQLPAIRRALGYIGVPYDEVAVGNLGTIRYVDSAAPCRGNYQAVHLTDGSLRLIGNGLLDANGLNLDIYGKEFGVRLVNWFIWPTPMFGFEMATGDVPGETGEALSFSVTPEGKKIFSYLNTDRVTVKDTLTYLAKPLSTAVPLLLDSTGNAGAVTYASNGLEQLTLTFMSHEASRYFRLLSYGIVNWSTRGRFLGNRRVYASAHIDDFFIPDAIWVPGTPCGTPTWQTEVTYRMNDADLTHVLSYQDRLHEDPMYADFVVDMVFNGFGAGNQFNPDTLTPLAKQRERDFKWISHGFAHLFLDPLSYDASYKEVKSNLMVAGRTQLNLTRYSDSCQVTGQVSGLRNKNFLSAAYDLGVRYLVTDTTRPGENPGDNLGLYDWDDPRIFLIPRRALNLFYNVALREEWMAEYNCIYGTEFWGRSLNVDEIVAFESDELLSYMVRGESYPWMFHQTNLRAFASQPGGKNIMLLEQLLDAAFGRYKALYNLPILSPTMEEIGQVIISHMEIKDVTAILAPGMGMLMQSTKDTTTPATGFHLPGGRKNIVYGGQKQTYVDLKAGVPMFVPLETLGDDIYI